MRAHPEPGRPLPWVTFDLDGTLLRSPYWHLHLRPWLKTFAGQRCENWSGLWQRLNDLSRQRWLGGRQVASYDWADMVQELWGHSLPNPTVPAMASLEPYVLGDAFRVIQQLRRLPVRLAIISNGYRKNQWPYIETAGFSWWFHDFAFADGEQAVKPHPKMFRRFRPLLCHVGDRLHHDVLGAHRAKAPAIWLKSPLTALDRIDRLSPASIAPEWTISHLSALVPVVAHLLSRWAPTH